MVMFRYWVKSFSFNWSIPFLFIPNIFITYIKVCKKRCNIAKKLIFGGFWPFESTHDSAQNPQVRTGWPTDRLNSGQLEWVNPLTLCIDSWSLFLWTWFPRVEIGQPTGRLNFGNHDWVDSLMPLHRLIVNFPFNRFAAGPDRSTHRSTQPWEALFESTHALFESTHNLFCKILHY